MHLSEQETQSTPVKTIPSSEGTQNTIVHHMHLSEQETQSTPVKTIPSSENTQNTPTFLRYALMKEPELKKLTCKSTATQTDLTSGQPRVAFSELTDECLSQNIQGLRKELLMSRVFENDNNCKFYTGLTVVGFSLVLKLVSKTAERMTYWRGNETGNDGAIPDRVQKEKKRVLTIREELLTTLIRLRRGLEVELLADMMGVSPTTISRIVITWIHMLCRELVFLIHWPTRQQIQATFPKAFRFYPKTRVIIDCTEFQIQRASLPSLQRKTYSSYKHRNTGKCLVGITPNGTFSFVSDVWTGCISDKNIVEKSGFCNLLEKGDDVMADRGFLIRDMVTLRKATLNIPPFTHGKQMSQAAVTKTRRIASLRIHVERAIGRLKQFRLLDETIPWQMNSLMSMCVKVAAALCNLDKPLLK